MRYALFGSLHNSLIAILGSILELERCEHKCVQYSRFKKEVWQYICRIENRASSYFLLTIILDDVSLMLLFSSSLSYMTTTLAIAGEMFPPCSYLSHDINVIVMNMHPRTLMRLT